MTVKNRTGIFVLVAALWLGVIAFVSLNPSPPGAETLRNMASWFPFPKVATRFLQAIIHGILFGVWAVLCAKILASVWPLTPAKWMFLFSLAAAAVVGVVVEVVQIWIPQRALGLTDFLGDVVGAALVLGLAWRMGLGPFCAAPVRSS